MRRLHSQISSPGLSSPVSDPDLSESRKRQSKRDEAIRRKNESDLLKKRNQPGKLKSRRPPPGTVLSLRPSPALQIKPTTTVSDAAQLMSARRENCVLVTDEDDRIAGIFTAKDLAFRVIGNGLDPRAVTVDKIMTTNPLCARTDTSATDALDLMVHKGFRHLPVMDENQDISGILDITKCFYEAMDKLERAYNSSKKLYDALEGVQSELGTSQPAPIFQYVEALRQKMSGPDLSTVLDGSAPVFVNIRATVKEAAVLMKENHTTAVLVTDKNSITGIFTSKDVVLRVIAAGLDANVCSVVRVMTPHPDFAPKSLSIQAALRKMHDGHYLNLPVMGDDDEVVGIVDVLRLTYATLEQINSIQTADSEGPAWNKFWTSFDNDTESFHSGSHITRGATPSSERCTNFGAGRPDSVIQGLQDVNPGDSISITGSNDGNPFERSTTILSGHVDTFPFKFKAPNGRVHRLNAGINRGIGPFREAIAAKLGKELEIVGGQGKFLPNGDIVEPGFAISYIDEEGDMVAITSDDDLTDASKIARQAGLDKVDIWVHHYDREPEISSQEIERHQAHVQDLKEKPVEKPFIEENEKAETVNSQYISGVPNDLLLPGAITFLGISMLAVIVLRR